MSETLTSKRTRELAVTKLEAQIVLIRQAVESAVSSRSIPVMVGLLKDIRSL